MKQDTKENIPSAINNSTYFDFCMLVVHVYIYGIDITYFVWIKCFVVLRLRVMFREGSMVQVPHRFMYIVCSQLKSFKIFFTFVSCDILMYRSLWGKILFEDFRNIVEICKVVFTPSYINVKLNILELFVYLVYFIKRSIGIWGVSSKSFKTMKICLLSNYTI